MPQVRPRRIWIGVAVAFLGMAVLAVAMTFARWQPWVWVGGGLVVLGLVVALLAGIMQDVQGGRHGFRAEAEDIRTGKPHPGAGPDSRLPVSSPPPPAAATVNAGAAEGTHIDPAPPTVRLQLLALAMVVLGAWMVIAPALLHNLDTETGNDVVFRDYAVAGLVLLTGLALHNIRRSPVLCVVPATAGAALLLATALNPPATSRLTVNEVITGLLAISFAAGYAVLRLSRG